MLLLVCEDLLDKISCGGIVSGCGGLGGCIELRASMALQCHVVDENLAHSCTDGERPDGEWWCAAGIDEPIKERAYRLMSKNSDTFTQRVRRNLTSHPIEFSMEASKEEWTFNRELQCKEKLEALLKTAAVCFNEMGYSGTSPRDLAGRLRCCAQLPVTLLHRVACSD